MPIALPASLTRHQAAGQPIQLVRGGEAETDDDGRGYSKHELVLDRQRRRRDDEDGDDAAEHDELVEAVGEHADEEIQNDRGDVPRADDDAGGRGV